MLRLRRVCITIRGGLACPGGDILLLDLGKRWREKGGGGGGGCCYLVLLSVRWCSQLSSVLSSFPFPFPPKLSLLSSILGLTNLIGLSARRNSNRLVHLI